jgi:hypothetical protein
MQDQFDKVIAAGESCLDDTDPWHGLERFMSEMVASRASDVGALEAVKDQCITSPELDWHRRRVMELASALVARAQKAGVVRSDLTGQDLGMLITAAASVGGLPFRGVREDLWRRYLGVILDGLWPEGASRLRPGPPPRRLFEAPTEFTRDT